jgi:hypothetical protein
VLAYVIAAVTLISFLAFYSTSLPNLINSGDKVANILNLVVTVAALVVAVASWRAAVVVADPDLLLGRAREELAGKVGEEWSKEAFVRGLSSPQPLKVRWSTTQRPVAAAPDEVIEMPAGRPIRLTLHGDVTTIAEAFRQLPARQLVVIGAPEAGKTSLAVLLVCSLLHPDHRRPEDPVPVILNLSGWDPNKPLDSWVSARLGDLYPWLLDKRRFGTNAPRRLVADHSRGVLPILDGLDELPKPLRHKAIVALNQAIRDSRPLVLTCRSNEYQAAVTAAGVPLARAAVVEIQPVTAAQASIYLPLAQHDGRKRWAPVIEHLNAHPEGALAKSLSTPLMVYLARIAYTKEDPRPLTLLTDTAAIEQDLLGRYLPAIYAPGLPEPEVGGRPQYQCTLAEARRWLGFLARHLKGGAAHAEDQDRAVDRGQGEDLDLAWWKLSEAAPRGLAGTVCGLLAGTVSALFLPVFVGRSDGRIVGLGFGLIAALGIGLIARRWTPHARTGLARGLVGGLLGSLAGSVLATAAFGVGPANSRVGAYLGAAVAVSIAVASLRRIVVALLAGFVGQIVVSAYEHAAALQDVRVSVGSWARIVDGIGIGLAVGLAAGLADRRTPARGTHWSLPGFAGGLVVGAAIGLSLWVQGRSAGSLIIGLVCVLLAGYAGGVFFEGSPTEVADATTPHSVLVRDRATFRDCGLIGFVGLALGLTYGYDTPGIQDRVQAGLALGLVNAVAGGLGLAFSQASWGSYTVARWWLAASSQLPWRLMAFLEDAHTPRGVLRQVGAVYQFRHRRLRDYLASMISEP